MKERIKTVLHYPRLVAIRRWLGLWLVFIVLAMVAGQVERWEEDFDGFWLLHIILYLIAGVGIVVLPVVATVWELRCWRRLKQSGAVSVTPDWRRGWVDLWLLGLVLLASWGLGMWFDMRAEARSELKFSCPGEHGEHIFARASWQSANVPAAEIGERLPAPAPHLHTIYLPDGDYHVHCQTGEPAFHVSLRRNAYSFTLRLESDKMEELQFFLYRLRSDEERSRVLLQMAKGGKYGAGLKNISFRSCMMEDGLYLSYGEYVLAMAPRGAALTPENSRLFYISMQP